jgi:hypothetical protein
VRKRTKIAIIAVMVMTAVTLQTEAIFADLLLENPSEFDLIEKTLAEIAQSGNSQIPIKFLRETLKNEKGPVFISDNRHGFKALFLLGNET